MLNIFTFQVQLNGTSVTLGTRENIFIMLKRFSAYNRTIICITNCILRSTPRFRESALVPKTIVASAVLKYFVSGAGDCPL